MKVSMVSLGCPKNTVDGARSRRTPPAPAASRRPPRAPALPAFAGNWSAAGLRRPRVSSPCSCTSRAGAGEVFLGDLFRSGFDITDAHEDADAIVINTCAFVEAAKAESIEVRRRPAQRAPSGLPTVLLGNC
jgi:tRNA A37 methylthiotransferase MiaB